MTITNLKTLTHTLLLLLPFLVHLQRAESFIDHIFYPEEEEEDD